MSMKTSIAYGYGFPLTSLTTEHFVSFINKHQHTMVKIKNSDKINETCKTAVDKLSNFCYFSKAEEITNLEIDDIANDFYAITDLYGEMGMLSIIALIMSVETNIMFNYQPGDGECDSEPSIILPSGNPWQFNEKEKQLKSADDLDEIIKPYTRELHIPEEEIGELEVEYYG